MVTNGAQPSFFETHDRTAYRTPHRTASCTFFTASHHEVTAYFQRSGEWMAASPGGLSAKPQTVFVWGPRRTRPSFAATLASARGPQCTRPSLAVTLIPARGPQQYGPTAVTLAPACSIRPRLGSRSPQLGVRPRLAVMLAPAKATSIGRTTPRRPAAFHSIKRLETSRQTTT